MASPFPNFEVGDIVDVSLAGGGLLDKYEITYVPIRQNLANEIYWELVNPDDGTHVIVSNFASMVKTVVLP